MAKNNPGDILTCDWNPVIGCDRYSIGCRKCWYMEGIFPWQQRLGNIPKHVSPNDVHVFDKRMSLDNLRTKKGIVGVCQHGDLFWEKVPDSTIHQVLDLVDQVAQKYSDRRYIIWTKRAKRMADFLASRYVEGLPDYLACSVSAENQNLADERFPHLARIKGMKIAMMEPMVGPVNISSYIYDLDWVVVGSETGGPSATPVALDWVRAVRDTTKSAGKLFFIKQLGNNHKHSIRLLDGHTWDEFPAGYLK